MRVASRFERFLIARLSVRQIVNGLGMSASALSVIGVVGIFGALSYASIAKELEFRATQTAARVAKYAYSTGPLWTFQSTRLAELIELPGVERAAFRQVITAEPGTKTVISEAREIQWPVLAATSPISSNGKLIGFAHIETSGRSLVYHGIFILALAVVFGCFANWCLRRFPLRALDHTFKQLRTEQETTNALSSRLELALDSMVQGLALFDQAGRCLVFNRQLVEMLAACGRPQDLPLTLTGVTTALETLPLDSTAAQPSVANFEHTMGERSIIVTQRAVASSGVLLMLEDVTIARKTNEKMRYLAQNDVLTGLANRATFNHALEAVIRHCSNTNPAVVYCLDLDRFKFVNDLLGHASGDEVLKQVAQRLRQSVRGSDLIARLSGDEFAIIQSDVGSVANVDIIAERIVHALQEPFRIDGHTVQIGVSIGIAVATHDAILAADVMKHADLALYQVKADGRNGYRYFEAGMDERLQNRLALERDLRHAVTKEEFELHYQPLFDLGTNRIVGCEALMRWQHPDRGLVSPAEFIPVAEDTGLIKPLGAWALKTACHVAASWPEDLTVAVNLSVIQFQGQNLLSDIRDALSTSGLAPRRLELEITESIILAQTEVVLGILSEIKAMGVKISMDDFGTGYSSLSYLQKFPFDKIKIDRSFVDGIDSKADSRAIVHAITSMSRSLGMTTTGEGVETEQELQILRENGCTQVQGYLISRPVPAATIATLLLKDVAHSRAA